MLNKQIWSIGALFRNPHIFEKYKFLKKTEKYTLEQLENLQYLNLKKILEFAYTYSDFYKNLYAKNNFNPFSDFNKIEDISNVPVISKSDLLKYNAQIHTKYKFNKIFKSETSGTTGQILKFKKDEHWDSFNRAVRMRGYSWHNVSIWERNGYFWGYNFSPLKAIKTKALDSLQNRFRLFTFEEDEIVKFCKKLNGASYLTGYSSMIYEVARKINSLTSNKFKNNLKMICGTSEKVFEHYQKEALKAFGKRIVNEYGAAEAGIIAFECPYGNMHITMEGVYVEEINNEIIVTNLVARSFPIIRYKLGDLIKLKSDNYTCKCGLKHRVIEEVLGRVGKLVYGYKNTYPSLTFYNIFKNLAFNQHLELNYQVIQPKQGSLRILIEKHITPLEKELINNEFKKYFNNDLNWQIITVSKLHPKNGKFVDFISEIN